MILEFEPPSPTSHTLVNKDVAYNAFWISFMYCGTQMAWAAQILYGSVWLSELGMEDSTLSWIWIGAPIVGLINQPLIGILSDHCTSSYGRRRIFIMLGVCLTAVGLIGFAMAEQIGILFGDTSDDRSVAIGFAIAFFWMFDISIDISQAPQRAFLADIVPEEGLLLGNSYFSFWGAFGQILTYGAASLPLMNYGAFSWFGSKMKVVYTFTAIMVVSTAGVTSWKIKETPWTNPENLPKPTIQSIYGEVIDGLNHLPLPIARAFAVQFTSFFAWYCVYVYGSDWMGEVIYGGDADADDDGEVDKYDEGVTETSYALIMMAILAILTSFSLPSLQKRFGLNIVWCISTAIHGICLVSTSFLTKGDNVAAVIIIVLLGFPFAVTYQVPPFSSFFFNQFLSFLFLIVFVGCCCVATVFYCIGLLPRG